MWCILQLSQLIQLCPGLWLAGGSRNSRFSRHESMPFLSGVKTPEFPPNLTAYCKRHQMTSSNITEAVVLHSFMLGADDWEAIRRGNNRPVWYVFDWGRLPAPYFLHMYFWTIQICGIFWFFFILLGLRYVNARQDIQIFMAISKPHDADLIKSIHNDSTLTQLSKHNKSKEEIHQYKGAFKEMFYTHLTAVMGVQYWIVSVDVTRSAIWQAKSTGDRLPPVTSLLNYSKQCIK